MYHINGNSPCISGAPVTSALYYLECSQGMAESYLDLDFSLDEEITDYVYYAQYYIKCS